MTDKATEKINGLAYNLGQANGTIHLILKDDEVLGEFASKGVPKQAIEDLSNSIEKVASAFYRRA